jgi:RND superfamily putative drug exporter
VVVITRGGQPLAAGDAAAIAALQRRIVSADPTRQGPPAQYSADGTTALLVVPLPADLSDKDVAATIDALRATVRDALAPGVESAVTGGPAFAADIGKVFEGADIRLLGATAGVVAVLLIITYRSPWLWLVPLGVVGTADQVAAKALAFLSRATELRADGAVTGITSVLVFGAGTNYALLIIARYREELRRTPDRHEAMRRALGAAAPAILASSSTVVLALLSLGLADDPFVQSLGYAGAVGIAVALAFALLVLPAAMVLFGRRLFWPFVPRLGDDAATGRGLWHRVGEAVVHRPVAVVVASTVLLAGFATGLASLDVGLSTTEQFLKKPEAVIGQERLARAFPAGSSQPAIVLARADQVDEVTAAARTVSGVRTITQTGGAGGTAELSVVLDADPGTATAYRIVHDLRAAVRGVPGADALVGGTDAEGLDARDTADHDRALLFPVILGIVLVVLLLLLRSVVASILLVLTVVATYAASLGASAFAFAHWFGFPAMDLSTPLLAFLFLVALGVDYNIFLTTRAREEATRGAPARRAIVTALSVTGGVITSAGILLAAVFAVLGVLPLIQLAQIGIIVGFGVLLDTLLVRSVLVPALVSLLGERFWWPGHPSGQAKGAPDREARPATVAPAPPQG